ncbi:hypothetical protein [Methylobacterium fujisawaense]|uniref:hypothetical protein n=1 Tax=Methylobacterium fujisawaense TaxID=107400 RepID=UPI002F35518C
MRDGWALCVRVVMLVLALAVAAPSPGLAEDLAFHAGDRHRGTELTVAATAAALEAADPGLACHVHCGCHQVADLQGAPVAPVPDPARPSYARTAEAPVAIAPDRLARPPRA